MQTPHAYWSAWAENLRHWKLSALAAWLLEAGGPFILLGSQAVYFSQPFLGGEQIKALARLLENEAEVKEFVTFLREGALE